MSASTSTSGLRRSTRVASATAAKLAAKGGAESGATSLPAYVRATTTRSPAKRAKRATCAEPTPGWERLAGTDSEDVTRDGRSSPFSFALQSVRPAARTLVAIIDSCLMAYTGGVESFSEEEGVECCEHVYFKFVERDDDVDVLADKLTCVMRTQRVAVRNFIVTEVRTLANLYDIIEEIFYENVAI